MQRELVSEDKLIEILNNELLKDDDFKNCQFDSVSILAEVDENGCNWSTAFFRSSGESTDPHKPMADKIVYLVKSKYNLI